MRKRIRIISGKWKGRKITIPDNTEIRPTPDRARETLFNWLSWKLENAHVLDLFAGTGILGLEALSRGARRVEFVDKDNTACNELVRVCEQLKCRPEEAVVHCKDAITLLKERSSCRWDIVFMDPPFSVPRLYRDALELVSAMLTPKGLLYVEYARRSPPVREGFGIFRSSTAGEVGFDLLKPINDKS